jgi:hypothetical protein
VEFIENDGWRLGTTVILETNKRLVKAGKGGQTCWRFIKPVGRKTFENFKKKGLGLDRFFGKTVLWICQLP